MDANKRVKNLIEGRCLDYKFGSHHGGLKYHPLMSALTKIPTKSPNNKQNCSPVKDQTDESSCSAFSTNAHHEANQKKATGSFVSLSENFNYRNTRTLEGDVNSDDGATTLLDVCGQMRNVGVCEEKLWPYSKDTLYATPPQECFDNAKLHTIGHLYSLQGEAQIKHNLASGFGCVLGFQVPRSFMSSSWWSSGYMPMPTWYDFIVGAHAVYAVDYDDADQSLLIKNSWGVSFGIEGYFRMKYAYAFNPQYTDDWYSFRLPPAPAAMPLGDNT